MNTVQLISAVRNSVCAVMRLHLKRAERVKKHKVQPAQYQLSFVGTAFGIVSNKYVLTAHHIFNGGSSRDPDDKFYLFVVPDNGPSAHAFPVISFPIERPDIDMAVMEFGPGMGGHAQSIPALPLAKQLPADGTPVLTYAFPSPLIESGGNIDQTGNWLGGGEFFLKAHANDGFVAGQYQTTGFDMLEFNVGWYSGESGGPVISAETGAAVAVMQAYRNIQAPHGIVPGPHLGRSVISLIPELTKLGVQII